MPKINKDSIEVTNYESKNSDLSFWLTQDTKARISHIEHLREVNYGNELKLGFQRFLEVIEPPQG